MLKTSELDYDLPPDRIAMVPTEPRDAARLLVVSRSRPEVREHRRFADLPEFLRPGDALVFNTSAVLPARFAGTRADTGGVVGGLFLKEAGLGLWQVMLQAGSRLRPGIQVELAPAAGAGVAARLELLEKSAEVWTVRATGTAGETAPAADLLERVGATPLPPYILKARRSAGVEPPEEADRRWYQTVYADSRHAGSVAAPTAGLHFTPELLERCAERGIQRADVRLHVGAGTFKPVQAEYVEQHPIHAEWVEVPAEAIRVMARARERDGRIVAIGTTSVRAIESVPSPPAPQTLREGFAGETRLLISPGFTFGRTDALVTNFHLPRSTLLALVAALFPEGPARLLDLYRQAIAEGYRFYSYGDAMLVLP